MGFGDVGAEAVGRLEASCDVVVGSGRGEKRCASWVVEIMKNW